MSSYVEVLVPYESSSKKLRIPPECLTNYHSLEILGRGTYGVVRKYECPWTKIGVAIKEIPWMGGKLDDNIKKEIDINQKLFHHNIVKYLGLHKLPTCLLLINELMSFSLVDMLKNIELKPGKPAISNQRILQYLHQILNGLAYLHQRSIVHRDLRPPNLLFASDGSLKLSDFGLSKQIDILMSDMSCTKNTGNTFYNAPEMFAGLRVTSSVDTWSLGIVILEMLQVKPPFMEPANTAKYMFDLVVSKKAPEIPEFASDDVKNVLDKCFEIDPVKRPDGIQMLAFLETFYSGAPGKKFDVFLSHDWGNESKNHKKVSIVNEHLKKAGFLTWFDSDPGRMNGHVDNTMAKAIEDSEVMLVFITDNYRNKVNGLTEKGESDNCYKEFKHGVTQLTPKKMLAVITEPGMCDDKTWRGTLGMNLASRIYVDISGDIEDEAYLREKVVELIERLNSIVCSEGERERSEKERQKREQERLEKERQEREQERLEKERQEWQELEWLEERYSRGVNHFKKNVRELELKKNTSELE